MQSYELSTDIRINVPIMKLYSYKKIATKKKKRE